LTVAKKHCLDCGADHICLTSENAHLKNYVFTNFAPKIGHVFSGIALPEFGRYSNGHTYGWICPCCVSCLSKQSGDFKNDDVTSGSMVPDFNGGKKQLLTEKIK